MSLKDEFKKEIVGNYEQWLENKLLDLREEFEEYKKDNEDTKNSSIEIKVSTYRCDECEYQDSENIDYPCILSVTDRLEEGVEPNLPKHCPLFTSNEPKWQELI